MDGAGALDKIVSPGGVIDVVPLPSGRVGYELRCYRLAQMDSSTWTPLAGQTPHTTWLFEDINHTGGSQLFVIKKPSGGSRWTVYNYRFNRMQIDTHVTQQGWALEVYDAQHTIGNNYSVIETLSRSVVLDTLTQDDVNDGLRKAVKIKTAKKTWTGLGAAAESTGGTLIESWENDYEILQNRYVVKQRRVGVSTADQKTTTYTYGADPNGHPAIEHETNSDGNWRHTYSHDINGRPIYWVEQYGNNTYDPATAQSTNRVFSISSMKDDSSLFSNITETTTETLASVVVARRWRRLENWGTILSTDDNNRRKVIESVATDPGVYTWDDSSNLRTTTYLYDTADEATGKRENAPWLVVFPDGQATLTKYLVGSTVINAVTVPTDIVETYHGVPSTTTPSGYTVSITAGTKTVEEHSETGQLVYKKVTDIASGVVIDDRQAVDFDEFGRVTRYILFANNSLTESRSYACCGLSSETDVYGVRTDYTYDALGRIKTRVDYANGTGDYPPVRHEFIYDALNRKVRTLIGPYSDSDATEALDYNLAGDLSRREDGVYNNRYTLYSRALIGGYIVRTTTMPDGAANPSGNILIERLYPDGRLYESQTTVTPTNTRGTRYTYATDSAGNQSVTETPLENGNELTAAAVIRWSDFAGRAWKVITPSPTETGTSVEQNYYATPSQATHKLGRLYKTTRTGRPDTLFFYDDLGRKTDEGQDINSDGVLTSSGGTDRLKQFFYPSGNGASGVTARIWQSSLGYMTEQYIKGYTPGGNVTSIRPGEDLSFVTSTITASTATLVRTETKGALRTVSTTKYGRLASVVTKDTATGAQLTAVTYAYNDLGQLSAQTDARNGETRYEYDSVGRISKVTSPDPDAAYNDVGRRPQIIRYIHTDLGSSAGFGRRLVTRRESAGATVEETVSEYYPTGELRFTYGANTSPSVYNYDYAGRMKSLSVWRSFNLATGVGTGTADVTTWAYTAAGQLKTKRDATNKGVDYTYDSAGRLKTRDWARLVAGIRSRTTYAYSPTTGDLTGIDYADNTFTTDVSYTGHDRIGRAATVSDGAGTRTLTYSTTHRLSEQYTAGPLGGFKVTAARDTGGRLDYLLAENSTAIDYYGYSAFYYWGAGSRLDSVVWYNGFTDPVDGEFFREYSVNYIYETNSNLVSQINTTFYDSLYEASYWPYSNTPLTQVKTYDHLDRVTAISATTVDNNGSPVTHAQAYAYNDRNQRTRSTSQSGSYWAYTYDSDSAPRGAGQVSSAVRRVSGGAAAPGFDFGYAYDAAGNRTSSSANGQTSAYYQGTNGGGAVGGNALNQYGSRGVPRVLDISGLADSSASVTVNNQATLRQGEHWFKQLMASGNDALWQSGNNALWQSVTVAINGTTTTGSLLLKNHPEAYSYDDDGNLLSDGRWVYTWDVENRLRRLETTSLAYAAGAPRKRIEYSYDDLGRRTLKSVFVWNTGTNAFSTSPTAKVGFIYHGWNLLQEVDLSGSSATTLRSYQWGLDMSGTLDGAGGVGGLLFADLRADGWGSVFYVSDANGNVSDLAWCQGGFTGHYEYDAFGNSFPENCDGNVLAGLNPFRFSTKYTETDDASGGNETGLLYYGFRYYNPSMGRWLSRDPIGEKGGVNLYGMVGNDPINNWDYLGLKIEWDYVTGDEAYIAYRKVKEERNWPTNLVLESDIRRRNGFKVWWTGSVSCKNPNRKGTVALVQYKNVNPDGSGGVPDNTQVGKPWCDRRNGTCSDGGYPSRMPAYLDGHRGGTPGISPKGSYIDSPTESQKFRVEAWVRCPCESDRLLESETITIDYNRYDR